eukprot:UN09592
MVLRTYKSHTITIYNIHSYMLYRLGLVSLGNRSRIRTLCIYVITSTLRTWYYEKVSCFVRDDTPPQYNETIIALRTWQYQENSTI